MAVELPNPISCSGVTCFRSGSPSVWGVIDGLVVTGSYGPGFTVDLVTFGLVFAAGSNIFIPEVPSAVHIHAPRFNNYLSELCF